MYKEGLTGGDRDGKIPPPSKFSPFLVFSSYFIKVVQIFENLLRVLKIGLFHPPKLKTVEPPSPEYVYDNFRKKFVTIRLSKLSSELS